MENNVNNRKWNKECLYSIGSFILAFLILLGFLNCLKNQSSSGSIILGQNIKFWLPIILIIVFLVLSFILGIKSINKNPSSLEKGKLLSIISTTVSFFAIIIFIISVLEYLL
jgi:hypothetical protein